MMQERALGARGERQRDSRTCGKGQMVAADFIVTPSVVISENNAGGVGGALGSLLGGRAGAALGAITGGLKFKRGRRPACCPGRLALEHPGRVRREGSAQNTDLRGSAARLVGNIAALAGSGYSNTPEGKVISAAFLDNWNKIVRHAPVQAQTVDGGLGEGGALGVQGGTTNASKKVGK